MNSSLTGAQQAVTSKDGNDAFQLSVSSLDEIRRLADLIDTNPHPLTHLRAEDFELPACRNDMAEVKQWLKTGPGFVIIDRLPLSEMSSDTATAVYWLLMGMVGRAVAQSWDGKIVYKVADITGKRPGNGIRPDVTNAEQNFHTDNSYNLCPPDYVTLLCLHPAKSGGISRVVKLQSALERMKKNHPDLLPRLFQPFYFDRQREHAPEDSPVIKREALYTANGRTEVRISQQLIRQGYALTGEDLDDDGDAALTAFYALINQPDAYREFLFEAGQIQIIDNRILLHKRTGFEDWPEPARRRHLVRLWLRQTGRPYYNG